MSRVASSTHTDPFTVPVPTTANAILRHYDDVLLLQRAVKAAAGVRPLCRRIHWHPGAAAEVLAQGAHLSPFRAAQCADLVGEDADEWIFAAFARKSKTDRERAYWLDRLEQRRRQC